MPTPCDLCHAGCCRSYHLFITPFDAFRIALDLALPLNEFAFLTLFSAADAVRYEEEYTALRFADRAEDERFFLALKRIESLLFPGTLRCFFLMEWHRESQVSERGEHPGRHTVGRCGIYGSRPQVCSTYPAALHAKAPVGVIANPPPAHVLPGHPVHTLCPEEWAAEHFGPKPDALLHGLAARQFEREFYNAAVAEFNEAQLGVNDYFPFMQKVYEERLRRIESSATA
jgi:Fe-S-cluster containining protein